MLRAHRSRAAVAFLFAATALQFGCTTQQGYGAAQAWQRAECRKLPVPEQQRCLASNAMSFDEYRREAAKARPAQ